MDDFVTSNLYSSRDEWTARLVTILTPHLMEGIKSIFQESYQLCITNDELSKYLLCFQNLLCQVPKWNATIIEQERQRIVEKSGCGYLTDLLTCVHVIQLKLLTCIRVGNRQKKIDISIPSLDSFLHKTYIQIARKVYMNVYLFEKNISSLLVQKNMREFEMLVQECILITVRESIPTETIIRAYMDESVEQEQEVTIEPVHEEVVGEEEEGVSAAAAAVAAGTDEDAVPKDIPKEASPPESVPSIKNMDSEIVTTRLTFNDYDKVMDEANRVTEVNAPKTIERLEEISTANALKRMLEDESDDADTEDEGTIRIHSDEAVDIGEMEDIFATAKPATASRDDEVLLDFEQL